MRLLFYLIAFNFLFTGTLKAENILQIYLPSESVYQKPDLRKTPKGEYILHKGNIDSEILILKEKFPELTSEVISYKFLYAPKTGKKQFFESDGGLFDLLKKYSRSIKPGDMINITEVVYKDISDTTGVWKKFETKLHFVYQ